MIPNQYLFEMIRDFILTFERMKPGEKVHITVRRQTSGDFFQFDGDPKWVFGGSESSVALEKAWKRQMEGHGDDNVDDLVEGLYQQITKLKTKLKV